MAYFRIMTHPIDDILAAKDMTRSDLARATGYSKQYVTNVLNGDKGASLKFAVAVDQAIGYPPSMWLGPGDAEAA